MLQCQGWSTAEFGSFPFQHSKLVLEQIDPPVQHYEHESQDWNIVFLNDISEVNANTAAAMKANHRSCVIAFSTFARAKL